MRATFGKPPGKLPGTSHLLGGGQDRRLTVDQFVPHDGRTCQALGDKSLSNRVFGENPAASVVTKENNG